MSISILLVDDHTILRQGLRALLETEEDFKIIGETHDGLEVLSLVAKFQPDIVVLDLFIDSLHGLEVIHQINRRFPRVQVVVLSMYSTEVYVVKALKNGANAYVLKGSDSSELIRAIRKVHSGDQYLSPQISEQAIEDFLQKMQPVELDPYETLTPREREVFNLSALGLSNAEIADQLCISVRTAEGHRSRMMRKLEINNQSDLIRQAIKRGILSMDD